MFLEKQDPGAGHVRIDPNSFTVESGTWDFANSSSYYYYSTLYNSSQASGDRISFKLFLAEGNYSIYHTGSRGSQFGILKLMLNGTYIDGVDEYNATPLYNQTVIFQTHISRSGIYTLEIFTDEKNASSSAYLISTQSITFVRDG